MLLRDFWLLYTRACCMRVARDAKHVAALEAAGSMSPHLHDQLPKYLRPLSPMVRRRGGCDSRFWSTVRLPPATCLSLFARSAFTGWMASFRANWT